jgi:hypothetical protein
MKIYQWDIDLEAIGDNQRFRYLANQGNPYCPLPLNLCGNVRREVVMADLDLWRPTPAVPVEEMRGTAHEETNYAIGWMLSTLLTLTVVGVVWTFGF